MKGVVSGSFHRHLQQIEVEATMLKAAGVEILSPLSFKKTGSYQGFIFLAGDPGDPRVIQDRHHAAIKEADFLWIVAPDGYAGVSVALEMGIAICRGIPIYGRTKLTDTTLAEYIKIISDVQELLHR